MGCDIHVYAEKKVNTDSSLKNLARLAIQKALSIIETEEKMRKQLETSDVPEELLEYIEAEPPGIWVNVYEDQVVRKDPNKIEDAFRPQIEVPSIFAWRSYALFSWLGNVRGFCENGAIAPRRGVPSDVSASIHELYEYWGNDAHSGSWCTAKEIFEWPGWDYEHENNDGSKQTRRETGSGAHFLDCMNRVVRDAGEEPRNVRIVFWFDN